MKPKYKTPNIKDKSDCSVDYSRRDRRNSDQSMGDGASSTFFDNYITMQELLFMLKGRYSRSTIDRWRQRGMPCRRLNGGRLWFPKKEVLKWIERNYQ